MADSDQWIDLLESRMGIEPLATSHRASLTRTRIGARSHKRGDTIVRRGDPEQPLHFMTSGWAARIHTLKQGSQSITDLVMPGEFCDFSRLNDGIWESAVALTDVDLVMFDRRAFLRLAEAIPGFGLSLLRLALGEQSILRQRVVGLGRYDKPRLLSHLLCELHERLRRLGLAKNGDFELPLTQEQLADATGMTSVHINRILRQLTEEGLIVRGHHHITVHDLPRLSEYSDFDDSYLT